MKSRITLIFAILNLGWMLSAQAETLYVTDSWRFEMRESPCWECTITRSLKSGTELTILETEESVEGWKKIQTQNGHQGWMSERYIQDSSSAASQLEEAQSITLLAITEQSLLRDQFELLTSEIQAAGIEIEMVEVASDDRLVVIQAPHVVGNLATVGSQNEELLRRNQLLQNELDLLNAVVDRLTDESWKKYFVYGGGAVFLGVLLCLVLTRIRPRKGYSEWA